MNLRSGISNFVALAVVAGLAIALAAQREARIKAETEHGALEQQLVTLRGLVAENAGLSNIVAQASAGKALPEDESGELLRLRGEVGALRRQTADLDGALAENREAHAAAEPGTNAVKGVPTADYWPRDSWAFAGYATPDAALQSSLWAANKGDLKTVAAAATGQLRDSLEAGLAEKSETEMSTRLMDEVAGVQSIQVLDRAVQPDGTVQITAVFQERYDTRTTKVILQKVGGEWKIAGGM